MHHKNVSAVEQTSVGHLAHVTDEVANKLAHVCSFILPPQRYAPFGAARPRRRGAGCLMVPPPPGSAAAAPAVLGWSRPSMAPTLLVRRQLLVVILMLHPGRRRPRLASGALVQNKLHVLRPAQQSRPVPPTDRNRCAFPHGKASPGRGASLLPAWCTAGAPRARSGRVPAPAPRQDGRPTASPGTRLAPPT